MSYETYPGTAVFLNEMSGRLLVIQDAAQRLQDALVVEQVRVPADTDYIVKQLDWISTTVKAARELATEYATRAPRFHG
jgi:hypothetical protein